MDTSAAEGAARLPLLHRALPLSRSSSSRLSRTNSAINNATGRWSDQDECLCRYCLQPGGATTDQELIRACGCKGSQQYVHYGCLLRWVGQGVASGRRNVLHCELCKRPFSGGHLALEATAGHAGGGIDLALLLAATESQPHHPSEPQMTPDQASHLRRVQQALLGARMLRRRQQPEQPEVPLGRRALNMAGQLGAIYWGAVLIPLEVLGQGMFWSPLSPPWVEFLGLIELFGHHNGDKGRCAQSLRVGHIPAGSTDAVACSLNGTRSVFTAAVHIALGDGTPLDVLRIDSADGHHEFATCMASYGFMGDLMECSERYRWLGPKRYDLVGAKMLAHNRAYHVRVSYLPSQHPRGVHSIVCRSGCQLCMMEEKPEALSTSFREGSQHSLARRGPEWRVVEDEFAGIMLVIMPCRSDKSTLGVAKYGHLCDGAIHLVLVRRCSRWQYLKFLLSMSKKGLEAGKVGGYIEVVPAVAVKIEPIGKESRWNVDGELLSNNHITAEVHRGLIEVFARGVEL